GCGSDDVCLLVFNEKVLLVFYVKRSLCEGAYQYVGVDSSDGRRPFRDQIVISQTRGKLGLGCGDICAKGQRGRLDYDIHIHSKIGFSWTIKYDRGAKGAA